MMSDDMVRVLQIKCRLHGSQVREKDVKISIERPVEGGEMTRVFLSRQMILKGFLLVVVVI